MTRPKARGSEPERIGAINFVPDSFWRNWTDDAVAKILASAPEGGLKDKARQVLAERLEKRIPVSLFS